MEGPRLDVSTLAIRVFTEAPAGKRSHKVTETIKGILKEDATAPRKRIAKAVVGTVLAVGAVAALAALTFNPATLTAIALGALIVGAIGIFVIRARAGELPTVRLEHFLLRLAERKDADELLQEYQLGADHFIDHVQLTLRKKVSPGIREAWLAVQPIQLPYEVPQSQTLESRA